MKPFRVPGRVEFLGKHTDYAGGRSLVCATEQGFEFTPTLLDQPVLRIRDASAGLTAELPLKPDLEIPRGSWVAYPATVVRRFARDFGALTQGLQLDFTSNLPPDAGVSSSSALVVGVALGVATANKLSERPAWRAALPDREHLAGYLGAVENGRAYGEFAADGGVGTLGGAQDQTAILCARPGMLVQYGWVPVRFERAVPWPAGYVIAVAVSGVVAAKTREALEHYNGVSRTAVELLELWNRGTGRNDPTLWVAVNAEDAPAEFKKILKRHPRAKAMEARLEQFTAEARDIIPAVAEALTRKEIAAVGPLVDTSQRGAERGLENQVRETIYLQQIARHLNAAAASAFGAGFGGSVWAMVEEKRAGEFLNTWSKDYRDTFPDRAEKCRFFLTRPGPSATEP